MDPTRSGAVRRGLIVGGATALLVVVVLAAAFVAAARVSVHAQGDSLAARTATLATSLEGRPSAEARRLSRAAGATARADAPAVAEPAPVALRPAPPSGPGWSVQGPAVQAVAPVSGGGVLVARQAMAGWITPSIVAVLVAIGGALALGALTGLLAARRGRGRERESAAAAVARAHAVGALADARRAAEAGIGLLDASVAPLRQPVVSRTSDGRTVRNDALERLAHGLPPHDRARFEELVAVALASSGPVARSLDTSDGRHLEIEAWSVPGGRMAALDDRLEERRLAELRRAIAGGAGARLGAPLAEARSAAARVLVSAPKPAADDAARALAAIDRAEQLVDAMTRGGDADPRRRRERPRRIGVSGALWSLAREWDRRLVGRHVRVEVEVAPGTPAVLVDRGALDDILGALMRNAADFTPGGGTIALSARPEGAAVRIEVHDSGPGFDPAEARTATEPFVRGAAAAARPGAGLGLASAAALATRAGGRLIVTEGTEGRVAVELPAARVAVDAHDGTVPRPDGLSATQASEAHRVGAP